MEEQVEVVVDKKEEIREKFQKLEDKAKLNPLSVSNIDINAYADWKEFIMDFLMEKNYNEFPTYETSNCDHGRNRSLEDIYSIVYNYYPEVTIFEVAEFLFRLISSEHQFSALYCPDIDKVVFFNNLYKGYMRYSSFKEFTEGYKDYIHKRVPKDKIYPKDWLIFE